MKHREHIRVKWRWRAGLSPSSGSLPALPDHKDVWSSFDPDLYLPSSSSSESFAFALLLQREAIIGLVTSITLKDNTEPNPVKTVARQTSFEEVDSGHLCRVDAVVSLPVYSSTRVSGLCGRILSLMIQLSKMGQLRLTKVPCLVSSPPCPLYIRIHGAGTYARRLTNINGYSSCKSRVNYS